MVCIYVLQLEKNKYYIGKTYNMEKRIKQHYNSNGSEWTKKYKFVKTLEILQNKDNEDEDKYTLKYMNKYGIDNVRGGSFCEIDLSEECKRVIEKMINGFNNKCYHCGKNDHYIKNCPNIKKNNIITKLKKEDRCFRCHRKGHFENKCYAKTYENGDYIYESDEEEYEEVWQCSYCNKEFSTKNGATYHENFYCKKKNKTYYRSRFAEQRSRKKK